MLAISVLNGLCITAGHLLKEEEGCNGRAVFLAETDPMALCRKESWIVEGTVNCVANRSHQKD